MGVGGVEAIEARRAWPIVTTDAMAIRSHGSAGRPNQEIRPVSPTTTTPYDLGAYDFSSCRNRSHVCPRVFRLKMGKLRSREQGQLPAPRSTQWLHQKQGLFPSSDSPIAL